MIAVMWRLGILRASASTIPESSKTFKLQVRCRRILITLWTVLFTAIFVVP